MPTKLAHVHLLGTNMTRRFNPRNKYGQMPIHLVTHDTTVEENWCLSVLIVSYRSGIVSLSHRKLRKNVHNTSIKRIRTDHGREFENALFTEFCNKAGILHEFSAPKTPQQNGIAERKNRTIQEMGRVMLNSMNVAKRFWGEAFNTTCHLINTVYLRPGTTMKSWRRRRGRLRRCLPSRF